MSKIRLNSITVNRSIPGDPMNYVGAVVESESGYLFPRLFTSTQMIDSILGKFKYNQMYRDLISRGIAVCLLPVVTKEGNYNKSSLRLSNGPIKVSHPKLGKIYDYDKLDSRILSKYTEVMSNDSFYGLSLDFTDVSLDELIAGDTKNDDSLDSNWIIINTGKPDTENNYWDQLISTDKDYNVSSSDYDYQDNPPIFIKYDIDGNLIIGDKYDYLNNLKSIWNSPRYQEDTGSICMSLEDLLISYIQRFIKSNGIPTSNPLSTLISIKEWKQKLVDESFKEDFYIYTNKFIGDKLNEIIKVYPDELSESTDTQWLTLTESNLINRIRYLKFENTKLLLLFKYPAVNLNHFQLPGLKIEPLYNYSQDVLCNYTNRDKVVEFYSKIKGPAGSDISITIDSPKFQENIYYVNITNGIIFESYTVKLFDLDNSLEDAIHITDIGKSSQLVDVYLYNYWYGEEITTDVTSQVLIDDRYFDVNGEFDYYSGNKRSESELKLPLGTFNLSRLADDPYDIDDKINSINLFKSSRWFPDLFLVPDLENDKRFLDCILSAVDNPNKDYLSADYDAQSMYSQSLINLDHKQLNSEWYTISNDGKYHKLECRNNRLLYFYGKVIIDGIEYPSFYPYIYNLMNQEYLEYPAQDIIYDPFKLDVGGTLLLYQNGILIDSCKIIHYQVTALGILLGLSSQHLSEDENNYFGILDVNKWTLRKINPETMQYIDGVHYDCKGIVDYLDERQINFMKYDNLTYFWDHIQETVDQPDVFMLRFISSKYVRETYKRSHEFVGNTSININKIARDINSRCMNYLELVSSSTCEVLFNTVEPNLMKITYTIEVKKLINRTYKLDIILNV